MKRLITILLVLGTTATLWAKKPNVAIYFNQYQNSKGQPYIETYFSLDPRSVIFSELADGNWHGGIEIILTIEQDKKIVAFDKLHLFSPETIDTNSFAAYTVQQSRMVLDPGTYTMKIELADVAKPTATQKLEKEILVFSEKETIKASSILILDSFEKSTEKSVASKWGYDMVPIVPMGTYVLNEDVKTLPFFCEIYNSDMSIGIEESFIIKYYLRDNMTNQIEKSFSGFQRAKGAAIIPVLNQFNIEKLPSGFYSLIVDVVDKENTTLKSEQVSFYRTNVSEDMNKYDLANIDLSQSFSSKIQNYDSLYYYIDCVYPIADLNERRISANVLRDGDTVLMKRFLTTFWVNRDPINYEENWESYMAKVEKMQAKFGSGSLKGYRTDMGRVYLQYGKPSLVELRPRDAYNYPYEIWQYDQLVSNSTTNQSNQNFVFVDQMLTGRDYTLIHSSANGEIQDYKWQYQLQRNTNRGQNIDASSTQSDRDPFGSRVENNFIIGDTRYWQGGQ